MSDRKYFVLCAANCKFESMTKEQILSAIVQAVESGEIHDVDTGFVTKLVEQNAKRAVTLWVGTRAQYNAIAAPVENCLYIITDDTTAEDFNKAIGNLQQRIAMNEKANATVDFSERVTITFGENAHLVENKRFVYDRACGVVHFVFKVTFLEDIPVRGEIIADIDLAEYTPKRGTSFPLAVYKSGEDAKGYIYRGETEAESCVLSVSPEIQAKKNDVLKISGWYFTEV